MVRSVTPVPSAEMRSSPRQLGSSPSRNQQHHHQNMTQPDSPSTKSKYHHPFTLKSIQKLPHHFILEFHSDSDPEEGNILEKCPLRDTFLYTSMIRLVPEDPKTEKPYTPFDLRLLDQETQVSVRSASPVSPRPKDGTLIVRYLVKVYSNGFMSDMWKQLTVDSRVLIRFIAMKCTEQGGCTGACFGTRVGIITGGTAISACWQYLNRMKQENQTVDMIAAYNTLEEIVLDSENHHTYKEYMSVVRKLAEQGVHFYATVANAAPPAILRERAAAAKDASTKPKQSEASTSTSSTPTSAPSSARRAVASSSPKICDPLWKGGRGFINSDMVRIMMPSPDDGPSVKIIVCGPPAMVRSFCGENCVKSYMQRLYTGSEVEGYETPPLAEGSILHTLGFTREQVVIL